MVPPCGARKPGPQSRDELRPDPFRTRGGDQSTERRQRAARGLGRGRGPRPHL